MKPIDGWTQESLLTSPTDLLVHAFPEITRGLGKKRTSDATGSNADDLTIDKRRPTQIAAGRSGYVFHPGLVSDLYDSEHVVLGGAVVDVGPKDVG